MTDRFLYLIRHGEQEPAEVDDPLGPALTRRGVEQARRLTGRLRVLPITAIHSSTLNRAGETAQLIGRDFPALEIQSSRSLWECVPTVPAHLVPFFATYETSALSQGTVHAESAFSRYFKRSHGEDAHELVICHGNLIRYFVCRVLRLSIQAWTKMDMNHCGLTEVFIGSDGQMSLVRHNDVGHLPQNLHTF